MNADPSVVAEALRRGASGYLTKTCTASELVAAVRAVLRGEIYISKTVPEDAVRYPALISAGRDRENPLTKRQAAHRCSRLSALLLQNKQCGDRAIILFRGPGAFEDKDPHERIFFNGVLQFHGSLCFCGPLLEFPYPQSTSLFPRQR
jgi:DNA-binding response OmpR family regulator